MSSKRPNAHLTESEITGDESPKRQKLDAASSTSITINNDHLQKLENIYLDTIDHKRLDFDFEKVCSITLSNVNIYGCLTCGKYFQGRGKSSPAYFHSVNEDHHVYINFTTLKAYLLPENQPVISTLLDDIKYAIDPTYTKSDVKKIATIQAKDINGQHYTPGFIGLNNIKSNDYSNVVLHLLSHIKLIRDFCLLGEDQKLLNKNELNKRFNLFVRKLWSPKLFKNHISPHELLQYVGIQSNKKFTINEQKSPKDFLLWLLNTLSRSFLNESTKTSVFNNAIQGKLTIKSRKLITDEETDQLITSEDVDQSTSKFWILTLDLPSISLFKAKSGVQEIPQIHIERLLEKYNGVNETVLPGKVVTYEISKYPPYLIFDYNRFKDKNLGIDLQVKDRNNTIVQYPLELGFKDGQIRYRLIANVVHSLVQSDELDKDDKSIWKVQLRNGDDWVEIDDLNVKKKEVAYIFLGETCLQLWERIK